MSDLLPRARFRRVEVTRPPPPAGDPRRRARGTFWGGASRRRTDERSRADGAEARKRLAAPRSHPVPLRAIRTRALVGR